MLHHAGLKQLRSSLLAISEFQSWLERHRHVDWNAFGNKPLERAWLFFLRLLYDEMQDKSGSEGRRRHA